MASAQAAIAEKALQVPPGSLRHTVLLSAKRFKASWVELGKLLVEVRDQEKYAEWGYGTFEAYCASELHIRKQTALKLTRSFSFLKKHEPAAMEEPRIIERAPAFEVVEVLADAEDRGQLTSSEYRSIRDSIWDSERPPTELKKEFQERFPRPPPEPPADEVILRRFAAAARKLANELAGYKRVPRAVAERATALAEDIENLGGRGDA
jgi:hypothetical protein